MGCDMEQRPPEQHDEEPEIDLQQPQQSASGAGRIDRLPVVYFAEEVVAEMKRHARSDTSREIAGVLVGEVNRERNTVIVHASIVAEHTESSRGNVTFTHDTWSQINATLDSTYPDQSIVGWYHSHPDFGVFLSSYDTFIHRNFFSAEWQIAYVVDPVRGDEGCFVWEGGELVRVPDMKLYMSMADYAQVEGTDTPKLPGSFTAAADAHSPEVIDMQTGQKWALLILSVLVGMAIVMQVFTVGEVMRLRERVDESATAVRSDIAGLQRSVGEKASEEPDAGTDIAAPPAASLPYEMYEVQPGDTLASVSEKFHGTPDNARLIAAVNGFHEGDQLKAGMKLLIPKLPAPQHTPEQRPEQ